ncbi:hypothetical protein ACHAXS_003866 [Conticribra weissflogii]
MKRLDLSGTMELLRRKSLPTSICRLVADLLECGMHNEGMFLSLGDVLSELMQIMNEPEIFVHEENNIGHVTLDFDENNLYGRNDTLTTLIQAALTAPLLSESDMSSVVLIGGHPGAGKSRLVNTIKEPIRKRGWHFLDCKFDRLSQNQPLSTISSSFDDFFRSLAKMRSELEDGELTDADLHHLIGSMTASMERHLSASGIVFLGNLIPSMKSLFPEIFRRVVANEDDSDDDQIQKHDRSNKRAVSNIVAGNEGVDVISDDERSIDSDNDNNDDDDDDDCLVSRSTKNRLHYLFQKLTQAISSPGAPIMLFLDDLQWADKESLELLTTLVVDVDPLSNEEDADQRCICFVLAFRNNDDCENQKLVKCINAIEESDATQVTRIQLDGMSVQGTNAMIATALKLPIRLTRPLADVVHQKTLGNPLFVKEFLTMLCEDRSLVYSLQEKRWLWTIDNIYRKSMNKDLALVLSEKLLRMPRDVQETLTFVSCFGKRVRKEVLSISSCDAEEYSRLLACLEAAVDENMLEEDNECYAFPHDLIQQAAYERVSQEQACSYHFNIGVQILQNSVFNGQADPVSLVSFTALDQILAAKSVTVSEPALRVPLAALFLRAGRYSLRVAAFPSALTYFERGTSFMGDDGWELNFELSLRLHESACHACYLNALPEKVQEYVEKVLSHTDNFMDRVKCHYMAMRTLASTGRIKKAISKFFEAMKELGEEFPDNVDSSLLVSTLTDMKNQLSKYSLEDFQKAPKMTDKRKQWAIIFMGSISPYIFMLSPMLSPMISVRIVSLSLRYGLTTESAFGLFMYSYGIGCVLQDIDEGHRWIKTSRMMLERFNATSQYPKLKIVQYAFLIYLKEPFQSITNVLLDCRQDTMRVGDIEYAIFNSLWHCQFAALTGEQLLRVEKGCDTLSKEMIRLKQTQSILDNASMHNMTLQLIGSSKNPFALPGVAFKDEDEALEFVEKSGNKTTAYSMYTYRVVTACFFQRYEYAAKIIEKYHSKIGNENFRVHTVIYKFYEGLVAFYMNRSQPDVDMWRKIGDKAIRNYQTWAKHSGWNFENKLLLLEAESLFSKGEYDSAEKKYVASIESARRHKFVHEEGLAMAMFSNYFKIFGNAGKKNEYLDGAFGCYEKWGAFGVVGHLRGN